MRRTRAALHALALDVSTARGSALQDALDRAEAQMLAIAHRRQRIGRLQGLMEAHTTAAQQTRLEDLARASAKRRRQAPVCKRYNNVAATLECGVFCAKALVRNAFRF
jgi:hypothetical protein